MKIYKSAISAIGVIIALLSSCIQGEDFESVWISTEYHSLRSSFYNISLGADGENMTRTENVTAADNTSWNVMGMPSWLSVAPASGKGNAAVTFTAQANKVPESRVAILSLKSQIPGYPYHEDFEVVQAGVSPYVRLGEKTLNCSASAYTGTIAVETNCSWTATTSATWLALTKTDSTHLAVSVKENTGNNRSATVYFKCGDTGLASLSVTQNAANVTSSLSDLTFSARGESKTVEIDADVTWQAELSSDVSSWISVTPQEGKAGKSSLTVTAQANTSTSPRSGYVYVKVGTTQKSSIYVSQKGAVVSADVDELTLMSTEDTRQIALSSDIDWSIISCPSWLKVTPKQGTAADVTLTLTCDDNPNTTVRTGTVEIGKEGFSGNKKVTVRQEGKHFSDLEDTMEFPNTASSQKLRVTADGTWQAASATSWISLSPASGTGDGEITVSVESNPEKDSRQGEIRVTVGETTKTIAVLQRGRYMEISCDDALTQSTPSTVKVSVSANVSWAATSNVAWLGVNPSSGMGDAELTVTVADNPSVNARQGNINFVADGVTKTLSFTQPGRTLTVNNTAVNFAYAGGTSDIIVTTDGQFKAESSADWITTSLSGNVVTVRVAENEADAKREGTVIISLTGLQSGESLVRTVKVTQDKNPTVPDTENIKEYTANGVKFKMIKVAGGTFMMGSESGSGDEKPVHQVTLSDYYIGETEVTQELWEAVMRETPTSDGGQWSSTYGLGADYPAYYVSWDNCQIFITMLNSWTGATFSLPTEAQWEFAARGGNKSQGYIYSGSNISDEVAWYGSNSGDKTHPVATKKANELGIYDMSGNVWEWCQDWYDSYASTSVTNPTGPTTGSDRVLRGGSSWWLMYTVWDRYSRLPIWRTHNGLRLALSDSQQEEIVISADVDDLTFSSTESRQITLSSNADWSIVSRPSWLTVSPNQGTAGTTTLTVTCNENPNTTPRTGTIEIGKEGFSGNKKITVQQEGKQIPGTENIKEYTANGVKFKMIKVAGGTFMMGSEDGYDREKPVHQVTLSDYYIGETEVTQELWEAVMGYTPTSDGSQWSSTYGLGDDNPAYYISWNDCQEFVTKLNALTGATFSLPTEAQWEFAARGGNKSQGYTYSGSNAIDDVAWYWDNSGSTTHAVGTKKANELGIYDMSGNVYEWCQDWYSSTYYTNSSVTNPTGPTTGSDRVNRGGGWYYNANGCRVANRSYLTPTDRNRSIGLRLALSPL